MKWHESDGSYTARPGNSLIAKEITDLTEGVDINERRRDVIWAKSATLMMHFSSLISKEMLGRWALVQARDQKIATVADYTTDLFRGTGGNRYIDFGSVTGPMHKRSYLFNTNRWDVLAQGQINLAGNDASAQYSGSKSSTFNLQRTIKLNVPVRYDGAGSSNTSVSGVHIIYWLSAINETSATPSGSNEYTSRVAVKLGFQD